ncbi:MAG: cytochrome c [Acidobacteria bacterium]|nr:cytochrome c [Acidobacteriota bacterium]
MNRTIPAALAGLALLAAMGCRQDMHDGPYLERLEKSTFFEDGRASRPPVPGTVADGELHADEHLYTGYVDGEPATTFPFAVTREVVERGRTRFEIFCRPCHGSLGDGYGTVVRRGFQQPPSYHIDRLRNAPPGHFYNVIANGYGRMYSFNDRIQTEDRWAIVAYIRALQLSQSTPLGDLPEGVVAELRAEGIQ